MKYLIFDFDGTIADTFPIVRKIGEQVFKDLFDKKVDFDLMKEIGMEKVIKNSEIAIWQIPRLLMELKNRLREEMGAAKVFPSMKKTIQELSQKHTLGILSSNSKQNIEEFLSRNKLLEYFEIIDADSTLFGKHRVIKKLYATYEITPDDMVYIGDETRDIKAAKKAKVKVLAVSWGYNSRSLLKTEKPDWIADSPEQILQLLG